MSPRIRLLVSLALLALGSLVPALPAGASPESARRERQAAELAQQAAAHAGLRTIEGRRVAIGELEQATMLDPGRPEYQLLLARTYYAAGFQRAAFKRFQLVIASMPDNPAGHYGLAQLLRRDWLKYLDTTSLARAADEFETAGRLDSTFVDAWLGLASLRVELHADSAALVAAACAHAAAPERPEPWLALGSTRWRMGDVSGADAAFRAALPRLPANVRERFDDLAPVVSEQDTLLYNHLPEAGRQEYARRFWAEHDPDLATAENEAQLEYWARVAQAFFLYYDTRRQEWDERGEVYVRYGPPESAEYNPLGASLHTSIGQSSKFLYPMNVLVWHYPQLGMEVTLQDRLLSEYYLLPIAYEHDPDPRPDPDSPALRDAVGTHELRGVFPSRPPRSTPVAMQGQVAVFAGPRGPRLFAALEAAALPGDSLRAEVVVLDSTRHEVLRDSRELSPSACDAASFRVADFGGELPPGDYLVGLSVAAGNRRGTVRLPLRVPPADTALALSDVVVTCGTPAVAGSSVRLDANPLARVGPDSPLTAYFEIYHLTLGPDGQARFEIQYSARSVATDGRIWIQRLLSSRGSPPAVEASMTEQYPGQLRRQFVSVPVKSLPVGSYRLEIRVRDLVSGDEVVRAARFVRVAGH